MDKLKSITFDSKKPGIDGGSIRFFFDSISDKEATRMTPDLRDGQELSITVVDDNVVIGRLTDNNPKSWLDLRYTLPNTEYFFI